MNKHMQVCDGFNSKQIHFTTSSEINRSQVIEISTSSNSSSSNSKNLEVHKQKLTDLLAEWICCNIRPISAVEDIGFKKLIEEATPIGCTCSPIQTETILSTRETVTKERKSSASSQREQIKKILQKAARERSLSLSLDIWSDAYRQQSYLECTAHWIDDKWILQYS